ncbi:MAG TPA: trigger factor, partial [Ktedonobacteraceae bacterium]|nr:trigger factor [Ktedonobacteraceae bacterium]
MKVTVEKLPDSEAVVEVDFSWDEVEKASEKAYRKLVQKVDVQGFRRGKAPRSLLERRLGKEYIYQEGLDDLMTETYRNALKEHDITPLAQPELDAPVFEMGQPYHFSLKVPILTPVELGDYRSLHFEREEAIVTSEEVEQELESLRDRQAKWEVVERPAQIGDRVTMDLKLTVDDESISDLKDNPFELTTERYGLFTGMDEHIVGMQAGESKTFTTTIPGDYSNEKLAGKEAQYAVTLHKIEVKELPELDDALAIQVSNDEYQTLEDLRKAISDNLLENKQRRIRDELREQVVNAIIDQSHFALHPVLIREEAEDMLHQFTHLLEDQHMSLDQYLMLLKKSREEYLKELEPDAEKRVKRQLVLDEVIKKEEISVAPEEVEALFRAYAQMGQNLPRTEEQIRALAQSLLREKAITRLVELAAGPDPASSEEEAGVANAEAAALAGDEEAKSIQEEEESQHEAAESRGT